LDPESCCLYEPVHVTTSFPLIYYTYKQIERTHYGMITKMSLQVPGIRLVFSFTHLRNQLLSTFLEVPTQG